MEDVGERIGSLPGVGEIAVEIHSIVVGDKTVEEQAVNALGLRIRGEAGIEIGGIGLDDEIERGRVEFLAAGAT